MHRDLINDLIRNRSIEKSYAVDRKTYWSYASYKAVAETGDLRYDYAHMMNKKWPGANNISEWIEKLPIEVNGRLIDYGRGQNKIDILHRNMSEEIRYEYTYFHLPEGDHYPVPKSFGGQFEFTNCIVRPKIANMMRQNLNDELLKEALKTTALSYNINQNA